MFDRNTSCPTFIIAFIAGWGAGKLEVLKKYCPWRTCSSFIFWSFSNKAFPYIDVLFCKEDFFHLIRYLAKKNKICFSWGWLVTEMRKSCCPGPGSSLIREEISPAIAKYFASSTEHNVRLFLSTSYYRSLQLLVHERVIWWLNRFTCCQCFSNGCIIVLSASVLCRVVRCPVHTNTVIRLE